MEKIETHIRLFRIEDVSDCAAIMAENSLWKRYGVTEGSAEKRFLSADPDRDTIFIAESENVISGFCWFIEKGAFNRSGYIQLIGVAPDKQSCGIGESLLKAAESVSFASGRDMFLTVSDFNLRAQKFYHRMGYRQVGSLPGYVLPDITELIYMKRAHLCDEKDAA